MWSASSTNSALLSLIVDDMENKWTDVHILFMAAEEGWKLFASLSLWSPFLSFSFFLFALSISLLSCETSPRKERILLRNYVLWIQWSASAFSLEETQNRVPSTSNVTVWSFPPAILSFLSRSISRSRKISCRRIDRHETISNQKHLFILRLVDRWTKPFICHTSGCTEDERFPRAWIITKKSGVYAPLNKHKSTNAKGV